MKTPFKFLIPAIVLGLSIAVKAQDEKPFASGFNFVNAIGLDSPTMLKINGNAYRPTGYKHGAITQGGMLYEGDYIAAVENGELKPATLKFVVDRNSSPILISYIKEETSDSGVKKRELRLIRLPNRPKSTQTAFWAIMVDEEKSVTVQANNQAIVLPPMKVVKLGDSGRMEIKLPEADQSFLTRKFSPDVPGNYILFFYPTETGVKFSFLLDEVMVVQREKDE